MLDTRKTSRGGYHIHAAFFNLLRHYFRGRYHHEIKTYPRVVSRPPLRREKPSTVFLIDLGGCWK